MVEDTIIKKGYKQTNLGVIPEDWDAITYGQVFNFLSTATYSRDELTDDDDIKYVHYGDIHTKWNHFLDFKKNSLPSVKKEKAKNYHLLKEGDLIMVDASEDYEGVAKSVEIKNIGLIKAISGLHTFLLRDKNNTFVNGFRGYISSSWFVKINLNKLATGLKVYGVSKSNLKTIQIPRPPKPEQNRIASVLSDIDSFIENLEKLIAKKKAIKKGTMQQLFTGKKRLGGFTEKWEKKKVRDFGEVITGSTPSTKIKEYWNGKIPWVTPTDITSNKDIFNTEREITNEGLKVIRQLPSNSLLITCIASIGKNTILRRAGSSNQQINAIIPNKKHDVDFLYYMFENSKQYLIRQSGVTATNIISKKDFIEISFTIPKLLEQVAIAQILSDIDEEINVLEQKRNKYKMIKIGMLQQLLTGKIRLL